MAEKEEVVLEESEDNAAEAEESKKGLNTALLIKIAIGLAVLLIILAVVLFFFKSSEQDTAAEDSNSELTEQSDSSNEDGEIALPETPDSSADNSDAQTSPDTSSIASSDKVLAQILDLQQQISDLKTDNQSLTEKITELTNENNDLKKEVEVFTNQLNSSEMPIDQLVNTRDLPRDYRRDDYANVPKFELEPKWGEFEKPSTAKQ